MSDRIVSTFTTVGTAHGTDYLPILVQTSPGSYSNCKIAVSDFSTASDGTGITINPTDTYIPVRINGSQFGDSPWYVPLPDTIYAATGASFIHHDLSSGYSYFYHVSTAALKTIGSNYISLQLSGIGENYSLGASIFASNPAAALIGAQQYSPALVVQGCGWSDYYGTSQYLAFGMVSAPAEASPDTGGQFRVVSSVNNSSAQLEFAVARNSGYSGLGTKFLSDDGTYYTVSSGSSSGASGGIVAYSTFSTGTTLVDLLPGQTRLNDPDASLATMLYISRLGFNGGDLTPDLLTIVNIGDYITLTQPTSLNVSWTYRVTALAISSGDATNGKIRIGVEQYNISTPSADNGAEVLLTVDISGSTGSSGGAFANPTALLGLTPVNGSGTEAMRADAAPALDQNISPTWTGSHTYNKGVFVGTNAEAYWLQPITTEVFVAYSNVALGDPPLRDAYLTVESDGNGTTYGQTFDTVEVDITKRLQLTAINSQDYYWRYETGNDGFGNGFVTARGVLGSDGIVTFFDPACSENNGYAYRFDTALVPLNTPDRIASFAYQGTEKFSIGANGYGTYATGICIGTTQQLRLNTNNGGHVQMGYVDGFPTVDISIFRVHDRGETAKSWINIAKVDTWPSYTAGGEWWANCGTSDCVMDISWLDGAGTSRDHVWTTGNTDAFFAYEMKRNGTAYTSLQPCIANSPNNVAYTFDTFNTLNAAGAKIASFRNNTVEKASIGVDGSGTLAGDLHANNGTITGNLYASNTVFGVGTLPVASAVSGTLYYDFAGSAYQQTTASGAFRLSAKNYRPGIAIVAQLISDGTARAITYDSAFAWFGTQIPSTVATTGKQILVTLTSTSSVASGVIAASTPQI